jgi:subtilisin family serine protease
MTRVVATLLVAVFLVTVGLFGVVAAAIPTPEVFLLEFPPARAQQGRPQPGQTIPWGVAKIGAPEAGALIDDAFEATIDVAVLDTGIDFDHPDLEANIAWAFDEIKDSTNPRDYNDRNGHGTHVAGTIAALDNDIGVLGVAPWIDIYAIKVLDNSGSGTWQDVADGILRAAAGPDGAVGTDDDAEVISLSLGGACGSSQSPSDLLQNAVQTAYAAGVVIVAAAGNGGDGDPNTNEVCYPAKYPEVIAVAATAADDTTPSWSSEGSEVEVAAPGVQILSTYANGRYETLSGTSMATPHVSGTVALILAMAAQQGVVLAVGTFGDTGTDTVRGILHTTAVDIETAGLDNFSGYGRIDALAAVGAVG